MTGKVPVEYMSLSTRWKDSRTVREPNTVHRGYKVSCALASQWLTTSSTMTQQPKKMLIYFGKKVDTNVIKPVSINGVCIERVKTFKLPVSYTHLTLPTKRIV